MAQGYVYALINPFFNGLVRIGNSVNDPIQKANEITLEIGAPSSFIVLFKIKVSDCYSAELDLRSQLKAKNINVSKDGECINVSLETIIREMLGIENQLKYRFNLSESFTTNSIQRLTDDELKEDFLQSLEIVRTEAYIPVLNNAEDLYYGLGETTQDFKAALKQYLLALELGAVETYSKIGEMYYLGEGCEMDYQISLNYLKEGVSKGNENCYAELGNLFYEQDDDFNMRKCFSKYFKCSTFELDKQFEIIVTDRFNYVMSYLTYIGNSINSIDEDIIEVLAKFKFEINEKYQKKIEYCLKNTKYENHIVSYVENRKKLFERFNSING